MSNDSKNCDGRYKICIPKRRPRPPLNAFADPSTGVSQPTYTRNVPPSVRRRTKPDGASRRQAFWLLLAWIGAVWILAWLATA
jgi:hypothetical protein